MIVCAYFLPALPALSAQPTSLYSDQMEHFWSRFDSLTLCICLPLLLHTLPAPSTTSASALTLALAPVPASISDTDKDHLTQEEAQEHK